MTAPTETSSLGDDALARVLVIPYSELPSSAKNALSIDALRSAFLSRGHTLAEFTRGLKYLLDNRFLKRINDNDLMLTDSGRQM